MIECVLFDFDETLTRRDTTRIWLTAFARVYPLRVALNARHVLGLYRAKRAPEKLQDAKFRMIGSMLRGLSPNDLVSVNEGYVRDVRRILRASAWEAMQAHHNAGRRVLVVTASPRVAVEQVFVGTEVETLGTEFAIENGSFTGALNGGGCFGAEKKLIIEAWAAARSEPVVFVEAWSDSLYDAGMLMLAKRRCWLCPPAHPSDVRVVDPAGVIVNGVES